MKESKESKEAVKRYIQEQEGKDVFNYEKIQTNVH